MDLFEQARPSVVVFFAKRTETVAPEGEAEGKPRQVTHTQSGTGIVLHPDGYVLSNSHMLRFEGQRRALLADGTECAVRVVARDDPRDLAVLKLDAPRPLAPMPLGRSSDLMVGEPVVSLGNPFGFGLSMSEGIISGLGRSTTTEHARLTGMVQTTAGINPGMSGGPLLNIAGRMVGLCTSRKTEGEGLGFAIPIDAIRGALPEVLAVERRYGFTLGLGVAEGGPAVVTEVSQGSPAEAAGIRPGDVVARIGDEEVSTGLDFHLALIERRGGESLPFVLRREGRSIRVPVTLGTVPLRPADEPQGLVPGVLFAHYHGRWKALPDFGQLEPVAWGTMETFGLGKYKGRDAFANLYTAYLRVPRDGVWVFYTRSDDGSRLRIGERTVVDNDGLHPAAEARGFIPLRAGHHRIEVAFFEAGGDEELEVFYEGPGVPRQPIPASALHRTDRPE
ncbi:MAG: trypsin-like peptidase domain-containing protein [Candidatus Brocadiia bacterium]